MTQNNIYMEDENLEIVVNVLPDAEDTIMNAALSAASSASSASASAAASSNLLESIRGIKTGAELFVAQTIENLQDLYSNSAAQLTTLKENCISNINSAYNSVVLLLQQAEAAIISRIQTLGSEYVNDAKSYAEAASEIVDFHVSTEHLNQSKGLLTGDVSQDSTVLANVKAYAHSTFDVNKFDKSTNWAANISDDGIVSGLTAGSYLQSVDSIDWSQPFFITAKFTTPASWNNSYENLLGKNGEAPVLRSYNGYLQLQISASPNIVITDSTLLSLNTTYWVKIRYNGTFGLLTKSTDGVNYTTVGSANGTSTLTSHKLTIGRYNDTNTDRYWTGTIDLKELNVYTGANDIPTFSGNQTGTDTYTIGGNTVTVPYTLSKTGSKIVDSNYRTQVTAVYNYQGYAPYYTLSDTNFTLPMGEVYGMIEILRNKIEELNT